MLQSRLYPECYRIAETNSVSFVVSSKVGQIPPNTSNDKCLSAALVLVVVLTLLCYYCWCFNFNNHLHFWCTDFTVQVSLARRSRICLKLQISLDRSTRLGCLFSPLLYALAVEFKPLLHKLIKTLLTTGGLMQTLLIYMGNALWAVSKQENLNKITLNQL